MILLLGNGVLGSEIARCLQLNNVAFYQAHRNEIDILSSYLDIKNQINVLQHKIGDRFTHVINAIGFTKVDAAEQQKELALTVNAYGANKLALFCSSQNKTLVQISTDFIFNGMNTVDHPYMEEDNPAPLNYYGYTKLLSEQMVKESGCKYLIVRTGKLYNRTGGFIFTILDKMKKEKRIFGVKNQTFTPTNAFNLATQLLDLIRYNVAGVYHVTNRGSTNAFDLIAFIKKMLDSSIEVDPIFLYENFSVARRPEMTALCLNKLDALGLLNMPEWEESLGDMLELI